MLSWKRNDCSYIYINASEQDSELVLNVIQTRPVKRYCKCIHLLCSRKIF